MHSPAQPRGAWVECQAESLEAGAIIAALRQGRFINRVVHGAVTSSGEATRVDHLRLATLRSAARAWNGLLDRLPGDARELVLRASRPIVARVTRRPADRG
jgi:hypothetical protein